MAAVYLFVLAQQEKVGGTAAHMVTHDCNLSQQTCLAVAIYMHPVRASDLLNPIKPCLPPHLPHAPCSLCLCVCHLLSQVVQVEHVGKGAGNLHAGWVWKSSSSGESGSSGSQHVWLSNSS